MNSLQIGQKSHSGGRRTVVLCANTAWNLGNFRGPVIRSLVGDGHRVIAAAAADGTEYRLVEMGAEFRAIPVEASSRNPLSDGRLFLALLALLRRERPDALLTFTIKPNIYGSLAARLTGIRVLPTVSGLGSAFLAGGTTGRLIDRLYRLGFKGAGAVVFQNGEDEALFLDRGLIGKGQARRVPGSGVDLKRFSVADPPPSGPPTFLLVGRMLWDKGIREYVEAARMVSGARFQLLGASGVDNPSAVPTAELERWAGDGTIEYLGAAEDVRPAIAAAGCLVLPSYREGLPRSLLEGAAMGRPLIAADVPGCRDVVEQGVNGFLCEARSASSLAEAIRRMIALPPEARRAMGLAGRDKIEREFAVETVVAAYRTELGF